MVESELAAIIGGSVAGAVVLVAFIAVIVFLCCGKRRKKKERDQKKFHQLSPQVSPTHSQPSSLSHGPSPHDLRLPKVGSNGLWMGTPGIYAGSPSPAYYYGRPGGKPPPHMVQPAVMQRASSETRISQRDKKVSGVGSMPSGPGIYAAGGSQQRIYHSQQLASLTPLYEVMDPRDGSIYDVYQIGAGSKTKLLQDSTGRSGERNSRSSKKVQRSHSDAVQDSSKRPHYHKSSNHRTSKTDSLTRETSSKTGNINRETSSKSGSITRETAQIHTSSQEMGVDNAAFKRSSEKISEDKPTSATDSMKLLAKNKTDDQKYVVQPSSDTESKPASSPPLDPSMHYTYGGDIYAVPNKEEPRRRSKSDNPILARMQDMVLEKAKSEDSDHVLDPITDLTETSDSLEMPPSHGDSGVGASLIQNPLYQDAEETVRTDSGVLEAIRHAADELDSGALGDSVVVVDDKGADDVAVTSAMTSVREAGMVSEMEEMGVSKNILDARLSTSTDTDGAGKHISVTTEAFGFLDTYLSDEDGLDMHSPPKSPTLSDRVEMMY